MKLEFSPRSLRDLREIQSHIAYDNIRAAQRVVDQIVNTAELLSGFPDLGQDYEKISGVRFLTLSNYPYTIYYRIDRDQDIVRILTVFHNRRLSPQL